MFTADQKSNKSRDCKYEVQFLQVNNMALQKG